MSNFAGLDIASNALAAHRRRIEIIGENIANANTPGYHRQRVELAPVDRSSTGIFSGSFRHPGGVDASTISRLRDRAFEQHARHQAGVSAARSREADLLSQIEQILGGLDDGGIHDQMSTLWNSFDDLASSPDDLAIRETVLQRAQSVADSFTRATTSIDQLRTREHEEILDTVDQLNSLTEQIAVLDNEIIGHVNTEANPNALLDSRDRKVAELARLGDLDVVELPTGQLSISIDGQLVVSNGESTDLTVEVESDPVLAPLGYSRISVVGPSGRQLGISGGELGGSLRATAVTIPDQRRAVDALMADLATQANAIHQTGAGLDGSTGLDLFEVGPGLGVLAVSPDVSGQPGKLAAAAAGAGELDDTVARQLAHLSESPTGPSAAFTERVGLLAAQVSTATGAAEAAEAASTQADNLVLSAGGVSLDQELVDLIVAQRSYEASARMITAIDEILSTLINSTGLVGR